MNCDLFALTRKTQRKIFFNSKIFFVVLPRAPVYRVLLWLNQIFEIFNAKWSCDKMLIDWLWSGWTGKYARCVQSVYHDLEPKFFSVRALRLDNFHYFLFPLWEWLLSRTKKKHQVFYFTHSSSGSSPTTALFTMVTNIRLTCRITRINQYQSSWFTVRPGLIYGFLHLTDVQRPVVYFFQIIRDLSRKISFSTAIISWVIPLMNSNQHESLIDIRPSSILIFSSVKFYLSNNVALRHNEYETLNWRVCKWINREIPVVSIQHNVSITS